MDSLFDQHTYQEIIERIEKLSPSSERKWGKMDVAQMLCHCEKAFHVPLSDHPIPRKLIGRLLGWIFKKKLYNDSPWKKNLPTSPDFLIKSAKDFETEKKSLLSGINRFYNLGKGKVGLYPHPMFGAYTQEQWAQSMYKHLDHHLKQFGV